MRVLSEIILPNNNFVNDDQAQELMETQFASNSKKRAVLERAAHFRHEQKYFINQGDAHLLERKLRITMDRDRFARKNNGYFIRSLYFDNFIDSAVVQKMAGVEARKKFRIRIYNFKDDNIRLECKQKEGAYIYKRSIAIDRKTCNALMQCDSRPLLRYDHPLALEMHTLVVSQKLRPTVLVDYFRQAFVSSIQDIRITFDKDLRTAYRCIDLFDEQAPTYRVANDYDMILEVKFNEYLPDYYHKLIQISRLQRSAISKYVLCRQFE